MGKKTYFITFFEPKEPPQTTIEPPGLRKVKNSKQTTKHKVAH